MAIALAVALTLAGTYFSGSFVVKGLCSPVAAGLYCLLYAKEFRRLVAIGKGLLASALGSVGNRKG